MSLINLKFLRHSHFEQNFMHGSEWNRWYLTIYWNVTQSLPCPTSATYSTSRSQTYNLRVGLQLPDRMSHLTDVILLFECCFVMFIHCIHFIHRLAFYLASVYNTAVWQYCSIKETFDWFYVFLSANGNGSIQSCILNRNKTNRGSKRSKLTILPRQPF